MHSHGWWGFIVKIAVYTCCLVRVLLLHVLFLQRGLENAEKETVEKISSLFSLCGGMML